MWIAHSNLTGFIKAADPDLLRLNLMLLLFVSFLPFTTAIAATHLFASNLSFHEITVSSSTERVAAVVFGLNLTLAALIVYLMLRHAGRTPGLAADDVAEEELQAFAKERRSAVLLQAGATVVGAFLPLTAVVFYLALSVFFVLDPLRHMRIRRGRPAGMKGEPAEYLRATMRSPADPERFPPGRRPASQVVITCHTATTTGPVTVTHGSPPASDPVPSPGKGPVTTAATARRLRRPRPSGATDSNSSGRRQAPATGRSTGARMSGNDLGYATPENRGSDRSVTCCENRAAGQAG